LRRPLRAARGAAANIDVHDGNPVRVGGQPPRRRGTAEAGAAPERLIG
jgi:hypothetical protein